MQLDQLATELLHHVFRSCNSVSDALALASTCRRLNRAFRTLPNKLQVLANAAEIEFGPVEDIIQLVTHNVSQPVHLYREAPMSDALLKQILQVGQVARKWETVYPIKKWKDDFVNRRSLTDEERFCLRRAVYRLWLYHRAFHIGCFDRFTRHLRHVVTERAQLLHNWSTAELSEIEDLRLVMSEIIRNHICPSNGAVQRKFRKRYPDSSHQLTFNIHLNYHYNNNQFYGPPESDSVDQFFYSAHPYSTAYGDPAKYRSRFRNDFFHDPGFEGWGDEIPHYYVVQDMMKLDPGQILWLRDHAPLKEQVEAFVCSLGDWFRNNGETFGDTLDWVMSERGDHLGELRSAIDDGELGIARDFSCRIIE